MNRQYHNMFKDRTGNIWKYVYYVYIYVHMYIYKTTKLWTFEIGLVSCKFPTCELPILFVSNNLYILLIGRPIVTVYTLSIMLFGRLLIFILYDDITYCLSRIIYCLLPRPIPTTRSGETKRQWRLDTWQQPHVWDVLLMESNSRQSVGHE